MHSAFFVVGDGAAEPVCASGQTDPMPDDSGGVTRYFQPCDGSGAGDAMGGRLSTLNAA